jgi:hypothetical protein
VRYDKNCQKERNDTDNTFFIIKHTWYFTVLGINSKAASW